MANIDAFATIRRARSLHERHADVPTSVVAVALCLASYADGRTGSNIRPGHELVAAQVGLSTRQVGRAVAWLIEHDELRCDKSAHRGSAAFYTMLGVTGKAVTGDLHSEKGSHTGSEWGSRVTPLQPNQPEHQDPPDPQDAAASHGKPCRKHAHVLVDPGYECYECQSEAYWREHGQATA